MAVAVNPGAPMRNDALLADSDGCYHCGERLPADPARFELDGTLREFCCDGCAAAAQWIRDAHLGDYYRLRSDHASRVGTAAAAGRAGLPALSGQWRGPRARTPPPAQPRPDPHRNRRAGFDAGDDAGRLAVPGYQRQHAAADP